MISYVLFGSNYLEDMFQLIGTPQGIEHVKVQFKVMPQGFKQGQIYGTKQSN